RGRTRRGEFVPGRDGKRTDPKGTQKIQRKKERCRGGTGNIGTDSLSENQTIRTGMKIFKQWLILSLIGFFAGCYSFKGVSIPTEVSSFYVEEFKISNRAMKAPRQLGVVFSDQ